MNDKKKLMLKILIGSLVLIISLFAFGVESFSSAYQQEVSVKTPMDATVTLSSSKDYFDAVDDVVLHVIIKNPNSYSIKILRWYTPLNGIERSLFTILRNGESVNYLGRMVKRAAPTDADYITLKGGENLTCNVNLSNYYDFLVSGDYEVTYDVASPQLYLEKEAMQLNNGYLKSNTVGIFVDGRTAHAP